MAYGKQQWAAYWLPQSTSQAKLAPKKKKKKSQALFGVYCPSLPGNTAPGNAVTEQQKGTSSHHLLDTHCKSWPSWASKFDLSPHPHLTPCQLMTTSSISTTFAEKMVPHPAEQKTHPKEPVKCWVMEFYTIGINRLSLSLANKTTQRLVVLYFG